MQHCIIDAVLYHQRRITPSTMHSTINAALLCRRWITSSMLHYIIKTTLLCQRCFAVPMLLYIVNASSHCHTVTSRFRLISQVYCKVRCFLFALIKIWPKLNKFIHTYNYTYLFCYVTNYRPACQWFVLFTKTCPILAAWYG